MPILNLKPSHKAVQTYYKEMANYARLGVKNELGTKDAFASLLKSCCNQLGWDLIQEKTIYLAKNKLIRFDGSIERDNLRHGVWEAKGMSENNLAKSVQDKFAHGYPKDNIMFQSPKQIIIWQDGRQVFDGNIQKDNDLVDSLKIFFEYSNKCIEEWEKAAAAFGDRVYDLSHKIIEAIDSQSKINKKFIDAFADFTKICRQAINPELSEATLKEMLIQHLLTERIFRRVFNNADFVKRNIIAVEIEKVINALTSKSFSREHFLEDSEYFYTTLENTAATIKDYGEKQHFLNRVYEKFFQGFATKVADTHGIVYTPQPIVNFMVESVEAILQREFNKSLSDEKVHVLDPFVGTGNFILRVMRQIRKTALNKKYQNELHCNEIMLLPYYIASMNIEHEYLEATGNYLPFEGICLVDTFLDQEVEQLDLFTPENTARVKKQRKANIFVVIGNPPYNAWQQNENDNNKNRKYKEKKSKKESQKENIDQRVKDTYAKDSKATNKISLSDPYIKAIRWATDRIGDEGIVAFVTNNSFIDNIAGDGMRQNLAKDFSCIYVLDLGGNVRQNPKLSGTTHNVFGIQVGVSINFLIRKTGKTSELAKIYYASVDQFWRKEQKYAYLEKCNNFSGVEWQLIEPDQKYNWLTAGLQNDFETFICMGNKEGKSVKSDGVDIIFKTYCGGVKTNRDTWVYNFNPDDLAENVKKMIATYNEQLENWKQNQDAKINIDDFVTYDNSKISWSGDLKTHLMKNVRLEYKPDHIRQSIYRPFTKSSLYFDPHLNNGRYLFPYIFPTPETEKENLVISVAGLGDRKGFGCFISKLITSLDFAFEKAQNFPFYTYDQDGTNRKENITDWALEQYQKQYKDQNITKWDIFYYIYALLHRPSYRETYAANLKRELPRIPFAAEFHPFAEAGKQLAEIHINYEKQPQYNLKFIENKEVPLNWRVEKMRLNKDKTAIIYNEFLTLSGIPPETFTYKLGNRSALEWIIDQYQVTTDKRSGIVNDPNRLDDEEYIVRLIRQVITVSLETVKIVEKLDR